MSLSFPNVEPLGSGTGSADFWSAWAAGLSVDINPRAYFRWKFVLDFGIAIALLLPVLPIIGLLALFVRLDSHGPAFFGQERVGKNGRLFIVLKLRTMVAGAEAQTGAVWTTLGDPRVTLVGRVLRKTHLDELPQLFNVLRGEMSLIGPRPERPEFVEVLRRKIPHYCDRLAVLPGVTGLAQINLAPDSDFESVARKLALDREYISRGGLLLDIRVLFCTTMLVLGFNGHCGRCLMGLRRNLSRLSNTEFSVIERKSPFHNAFATVPTAAPHDGNGRKPGAKPHTIRTAVSTDAKVRTPHERTIPTRPKPR
jgi:lipopolysaccharide/colanic/teichoic acid biosynthesis glycosyltransferase